MTEFNPYAVGEVIRRLRKEKRSRKKFSAVWSEWPAVIWR